jgi:hypothetical protein
MEIPDWLTLLKKDADAQALKHEMARLYPGVAKMRRLRLSGAAGGVVGEDGNLLILNKKIGYFVVMNTACRPGAGRHSNQSRKKKFKAVHFLAPASASRG